MFSDRIKLRDIPVNRITLNEILNELPCILKKRIPVHIVTLNALMFRSARKSKAFAKIINLAELVVPDGRGIMWAARLYGQPLSERLRGIDLLKSFLNFANDHSCSVFFLGGRSRMMEQFRSVVSRTYKKIRIAGTHHGYFSPLREKEIVEAVRKVNPDFIFVGMGAVRQEVFIHNYRKQMKVPVMMGVGGSFDVLSGRNPDCPVWIRNSGMEWLFRLFVSPRRVLPAFGLPCFVLELLWHRFFGKKKEKERK